MKQHPLSAAFPAMSAEDFEALKDSIADIGVQNPITIFEGMVIDGWHRFTAANEVGMPCPTVDLADIDPRVFVLAQNKARRHISQAQLAMAVTAVHAWRPLGDQKAATVGTQCPPKTTKELAEAAGVGERTIKQAKTVQSKAAPEVQEAVKRGDIGLPKAAKIAQLPKEEQAAAISKPAPKKEAEEVEYFGPSDEEIAAAEAETASDLALLHKLIDADDKLSVVVAENNQLRAELAVVKLSRDGYMNKSNELIRRVNTLRRKLEKAEAANA